MRFFWIGLLGISAASPAFDFLSMRALADDSSQAQSTEKTSATKVEPAKQLTTDINPRLDGISRNSGSEKLRQADALFWTLAKYQREHVDPDAQTRKQITHQLISDYQGMSAADATREKFRVAVLEILTAWGDNEAGQRFVLDALRTGGKREREAIATYIGDSSSLIDRKLSYDLFEELFSSKSIGLELFMHTAPIIDHERARPMVLRALSEETDPYRFRIAVRSAQVYNLQFIPKIIENARRFVKRGESAATDSPFWEIIDSTILSTYLGSATPNETTQGLEAVRDGLSDWTWPVRTILEKGLLNSPDPGVRSASAQVLGRAGYDTVGYKQLVTLERIDARLGLERDPQVIKSLIAAANEIRKRKGLPPEPDRGRSP